jgi:hypothetical protein
MIVESPSQACLVRMVRLMGMLVPAQFRSDWCREWEAEVVNRWLQLERWGRLDAQSKADLWKRIRGALIDVLWFQQRRIQLLLVTLNLVAAALTSYGAGQEIMAGGILKHEAQPFFLSLAGLVVSILFVTSGVAMLRRWSNARPLIIATGALSILVHVYGSLPPHRIMSYAAVLVGAGYGLLMLLVFEWSRRRNLIPN